MFCSCLCWLIEFCLDLSSNFLYFWDLFLYFFVFFIFYCRFGFKEYYKSFMKLGGLGYIIFFVGWRESSEEKERE